jgi:hypothetical protein
MPGWRLNNGASLDPHPASVTSVIITAARRITLSTLVVAARMAAVD